MSKITKINVDGTSYDVADLSARNDIVQIKEELSGSGGTSSWIDLNDKPFASIGNTLKVVNNSLEVNTTNAVEEDNTLPITSATVYTEIGNINALLSRI